MYDRDPDILPSFWGQTLCRARPDQTVRFLVLKIQTGNGRRGLWAVVSGIHLLILSLPSYLLVACWF